MQSTERWLPVVGHEGSYEVSDRGRVRSLDRVIENRLNRRCFRRGKVISLYTMPNGYQQVGLGQHEKRYVHRLVLEAFVGPCPDGMEACHGDGTRANNVLSNLRWDTISENHRDAVRHGTHSETRKSHCPLGHRLIAPNLIVAESEKGRRACLACGRARAFARYRQIAFTKELADRYHADGATRRTPLRRKEARALERALTVATDD